MSESILVRDDCCSASFDSLSSCRTLGDKLAHLCVCVRPRVFMCDPRQVPASMTRFYHLRARHISQWQLRARTLSEGYVKVCVCVRVSVSVCVRMCVCVSDCSCFYSLSVFLPLCVHSLCIGVCNVRVNMTQNQCQSLFYVCYSDHSTSSLGLSLWQWSAAFSQ